MRCSAQRQTRLITSEAAWHVRCMEWSAVHKAGLRSLSIFEGRTGHCKHRTEHRVKRRTCRLRSSQCSQPTSSPWTSTNCAHDVQVINAILCQVFSDNYLLDCASPMRMIHMRHIAYIGWTCTCRMHAQHCSRSAAPQTCQCHNSCLPRVDTISMNATRAFA